MSVLSAPESNLKVMGEPAMGRQTVQGAVESGTNSESEQVALPMNNESTGGWDRVASEAEAGAPGPRGRCRGWC